MPQLNTSDHIHNLNVFVNSILSEYNYYYELVNKCDKATNDYLHQSVLLFKEVSNMKRKKVIHIKSVHRYDHTCSFGDYILPFAMRLSGLQRNALNLISK